MTIINPDKKLTLMQAVRLGLCSYSQIYRLVRSGTIASSFEGRLRVVQAKDVMMQFGVPNHEGQVVLGLSDLAARWKISKQAVHKRLRNDKGFPKPLGTINGNSVPVWDESDIRIYEARTTRGGARHSRSYGAISDAYKLHKLLSED